jgi:hypothetical protein
VKWLLVGVNDQVVRVLPAPGNERLCDGEGGGSIGEADLDHRPRTLSEEGIPEGIGVGSWNGDPRKVTF